MSDTTPPAAAPRPPPIDPEAMLRSRNFVVLLIFAAIVGVFVSLASWGFLELVHQIQVGVFSDLPDALGYDTMPTWWPIPVLVFAGIPVAFAIVKLVLGPEAPLIAIGRRRAGYGLTTSMTRPVRAVRSTLALSSA
jgi:H+/Cl- antiporter ClcA